MDGLEDVMVTFRRQLYVIRPVNAELHLALARHNLKRIENDLSV